MQFFLIALKEDLPKKIKINTLIVNIDVIFLQHDR
jgi:hypothetical protein